MIICLLYTSNLSRQKIFKEKILRDTNQRKIFNEKYNYNENTHDGGERFSDLRIMNYKSSGARYTVNNSVKVLSLIHI